MGVPVFRWQWSLTQTLSSVDEGLSGFGVLKEGRSLDVVPLCDVSGGRVARTVNGSPFRVKGSTTFFLIPLFPFERRLFLPTALQVSLFPL